MHSSWVGSKPILFPRALTPVSDAKWGIYERKRARTEFGRYVGMRALPGVQVVESAAEEYPEEREEGVRFGREDRVEFEQWVKVKYCRDGHRSSDRV